MLIKYLASIALSWSIASCDSSESQKLPAELRGHSLNLGGFAHGAVAARGMRYCTTCHGTELAGGDQGEPSCLTCHGQTWSDAASPAAPSDHTLSHQGFRHHPNHSTPRSTCATASCHGTELNGQNDGNTPSCYLCHDQLWQ